MCERIPSSRSSMFGARMAMMRKFIVTGGGHANRAWVWLPRPWIMEVTREVVAAVRGEWERLCQQLQLSGDATERWWREIEGRYSEPHRYYHTLGHLADMLRHRQHIPNGSAQTTQVSLAIFFHEYVSFVSSWTKTVIDCSLCSASSTILGLPTMKKGVLSCSERLLRSCH